MKKIPLSLTASLLLCFLLGSRLSIAQPQTAETMRFDMQYLLSLPEGYEKDSLNKWPLVIFLHGGGECGEDLEQVKVNGLPKLIAQGKKFPFITVSPLATIWFGWEPDVLLRFLAGLHQKLKIDPDRIYLTGLSLGGEATWKLALKQPRLFAAIAPVCASGDTSEIWKLRNMSVWAFHGARDDVVPPAKGEAMVNALKKYNPKARMTMYPNANHNSWDSAYNTEELYTWLLAQKKYKPVAGKLPADSLQQYAGTYIADGETFIISLTPEGLVTKLHGENRHLAFLQTDEFFIKEMEQFQLSFQRGKNGITGFILYGEQKTVYTKHP